MITKLDEALRLFLEFAVDFHVKRLSLNDTTLSQSKLIIDTWKVEHIDYHSVNSDMRDVLQWESVKVVLFFLKIGLLYRGKNPCGIF